MRTIQVLLFLSVLPAPAFAQYCKPGSLLSYTDGLYRDMATKYASSKGCPASLRRPRTSCEDLKPPPPAPDGSVVPSSSDGPGPGCKAEYTVSHRKAGGMSYTVYAAKPPSRPKKTILMMCGGPTVCDTGAPGKFVPPGYDVILFDYPGLGKNASAPAKDHNPEGAARLALSIIKKEQNTMGSYVIAGSSWGTKPATIAASRLKGLRKPKSLLLDGVTGPSKVYQPPTEVAPEPSDWPPAARGLDSRFRLFVEQMVATSDRKELEKLDSEGMKACLKEAGEAQTALAGCRYYRDFADNQDAYREAADCKTKYDYRTQGYRVDPGLPIQYISGDRDETTPPAFAADHAAFQKRANPAKSALRGCDHAMFTSSGLDCGSNAKIWEAAFAGKPQDFSGSIGCGRETAPAPRSAHPETAR
jgi:pimeloyl-ACP methyl ester carboxylesterase